ncbi:MAG: Epimerase [Devosia sp.]|uniref:LysR family transcriptional regulator n=1 Tax=Devosia sp. TaxID=1871048 RepID=UPI002628E42E|nr:LysR family transcriptional regulator [Devosia sp.]MDB5587178.1 Epimerase [Devosia sp.]
MKTMVRVVDAGSFSAAGRHLGVSQSAVSKIIAQLEAKLGVKLLTRTTRGLATTDAGKRYYGLALQTLETADEAEAAARDAVSTLSGQLRLSTAVSFGRLQIVPHLGEFMAAHPNLSIDLVMDDRPIDLIEEGIDVALRLGPQPDSRLSGRVIGSRRRILVAAFSADLVRGMEGCDVLIHAAADTDHGPGTENQQRVNEEGTKAVFEAARAGGIQRAIYLSTESVLADGRPIINVDERHPLPRRPAGSYSRSKAAAERCAVSYNSRGMEVIAVRPRFVWGRDDTTALPKLLGAVQSGQFAWISGGDYLTTTIHIANLCHGIELAIARGRGGEIYFLGDEEPVRFRDFATALMETQGVTAPEKSVPRALLRFIAGMGDRLHKLSGGKINAPLTLQSFATSAVTITLNIDKARSELGYTPIMTREAGLAEMAADRQNAAR